MSATYDSSTANEFFISGDQSIYYGYGEYLFCKNDDSKVSYELYLEIWKTYLEFKKNDSNDPDTQDNSYLDLNKRISRIDSSLRAIFVPRTLYELLFIQVAHQEELNSVDSKLKCYANCDEYSDTKNWLIENESKVDFEELESRCWHVISSEDGPGVDDMDPFLLKIAFRFNNYALIKLSPYLGNQIYQFSLTEILNLTIDTLHFFHELHESSGEALSKKALQKGKNKTAKALWAFTSESKRGGNKPLGITTEQDGIILNAIKIECLASSFLLYRGGNLSIDTIKHDDEIQPVSLSFGSSLFAGCFNDIGACVFSYIRGGDRDGYIISIPNGTDKHPFYIPEKSVLSQLFSKGEYFHARSQVYPESGKRFNGGFQQWSLESLPEVLKYPYSKEEFQKNYKDMMEAAFLLISTTETTSLQIA